MMPNIVRRQTESPRRVPLRSLAWLCQGSAVETDKALRVFVTSDGQIVAMSGAVDDIQRDISVGSLSAGEHLPGTGKRHLAASIDEQDRTRLKLVDDVKRRENAHVKPGCQAIRDRGPSSDQAVKRITLSTDTQLFGKVVISAFGRYRPQCWQASRPSPGGRWRRS